jgi:aryl-alcohol dehydrogenase-like predicted oxidoreductase
MKFRHLGRTPLQVSDVACGLWGMSGWKDSDDTQSRASLQLAADLGCNFYDSAWAYGDGKSDGLFGELRIKNRDKNLLGASKVQPLNRQWPASGSYQETFPAKHVFDTADAIRGKFGVDTIDLLQFHVWDDSWTDEREFRDTVEKLKRDRIVRWFGLSLNRWEPWNGLRAIGTGLVDTVQVIYNLFDQAPEDELFPLCRERKVGVIARVPLDEGSLGGKLTLDSRWPERDWRNTYFNAENLKATIERVDKLKKILPAGMSLPEMAIRFILSNRDVSTAIVGMRRPEHVRANLQYSDAGALDPGLVSELKKHRWDRKPKPWSA